MKNKYSLTKLDWIYGAFVMGALAILIALSSRDVAAQGNEVRISQGDRAQYEFYVGGVVELQDGGETICIVDRQRATTRGYCAPFNRLTIGE